MELYQRLKSTGLKEAWCSGQVIHYETDSLQNAVRKYLSYGQSITAFRVNEAKAPYKATFTLTLSTAAQMLRDSGRSTECLLRLLILGYCENFQRSFRIPVTAEVD